MKVTEPRSLCPNTTSVRPRSARPVSKPQSHVYGPAQPKEPEPKSICPISARCQKANGRMPTSGHPISSSPTKVGGPIIGNPITKIPSPSPRPKWNGSGSSSRKGPEVDSRNRKLEPLVTNNRKVSCPQLLLNGTGVAFAARAEGWASQRSNSTSGDLGIPGLGNLGTPRPVCPRPRPAGGLGRKTKLGRARPVLSVKSCLPTPPVKITICPDSPDSCSSVRARELNLHKLMEGIILSATAGARGNEFMDVLWADLGSSHCTDFGITDYLSKSGDEEEEDKSESESDDTESHILDATPPHRWSDSDIESIEPLSVSLETVLNPEPRILEHSNRNHNNPHPLELTARPSEEVAEQRAEETLTQLREMHNQRNSSRSSGAANESFCPRRKLFLRHASLPALLIMERFRAKTESHLKTLSTSMLVNGDLRRHHVSQQNVRLLSRLNSLSSEDMENWSRGSDASVNNFGKVFFRDCSIASNSNDNSVSIEDFRELSLDLLDEVENNNNMSRIENDAAFTTDLERRAIVMRNIRRLRRQDTLGNIAPADYCNTYTDKM